MGGAFYFTECCRGDLSVCLATKRLAWPADKQVSASSFPDKSGTIHRSRKGRRLVSCIGLKSTGIGERWPHPETRFMQNRRGLTARLCSYCLPCDTSYVGPCCPYRSIWVVLRGRLVSKTLYIPSPLPRTSLRPFLLFIVLRTVKVLL